MSLKTTFYEVENFYRLNKDYIKDEFGSWEAFCRLAQEGKIYLPGGLGNLNAILFTLDWFENGRPYYKIYSAVMDQFLKTRIDISGDLLRVPHQCFAIRLPNLDHPYLSWQYKGTLYYVKSILVRECCDVIAYAINCSCDEWEKEKYKGDCIVVRNIVINKEVSIEENFSAQPNIMYNGTDMSFPSEIQDACIRLIVSTCFIATGSHKILEYDVLQKHLDAYKKLKGNSERKKKYRQTAKKKGKYGWNIGRDEGRDLHLPRGVNYVDGIRKAGGRELLFSHIRGGHWHTVCFGSKRLLRKVVWFDSTVVKPELPCKKAS